MQLQRQITCDRTRCHNQHLAKTICSVSRTSATLPWQHVEVVLKPVSLKMSFPEVPMIVPASRSRLAYSHVLWSLCRSSFSLESTVHLVCSLSPAGQIPGSFCVAARARQPENCSVAAGEQAVNACNLCTAGRLQLVHHWSPVQQAADESSPAGASRFRRFTHNTAGCKATATLSHAFKISREARAQVGMHAMMALLACAQNGASHVLCSMANVCTCKVRGYM